MIGGGRRRETQLTKTDSLGDTLWVKDCYDYAPDPPYEYPYEYGGGIGLWVDVTSNGGYIVAGWSGWVPDGDVWLLKTDSLGNKVWERYYTYDDDSFDEGTWGTKTSDGGYAIVAIFDGGSSPAIIKTDSLGNEEWISIIYEGVVVGGSFCIHQTMDKGYIICTPPWSIGGNRVIKTDSLGRVVWWREYGVTYVEETLDGDYIITGGILGIVLLAKIHKKTNVEEEKMTNDELRMTKIKVYPNPFVQFAVIGLRLSVCGDKVLKIKIHDLAGKVVEETLIGGNQQTTIGKNLAPGVYFIKANGYTPVKIIKLGR
jgi:hypothetical protein